MDGEHYDPNHVSSYVINEATIKIVLVLMIMTEWASLLADVNKIFIME